jgi:hypothetical protein
MQAYVKLGAGRLGYKTNCANKANFLNFVQSVVVGQTMINTI